jgi:hypothetical protein
MGWKGALDMADGLGVGWGDVVWICWFAVTGPEEHSFCVSGSCRIIECHND